VQQFAPELISTDARGYQSVDYARLSTYALAYCKRLEAAWLPAALHRLGLVVDSG
jgi:hypothetical protein